MAVLRWAGRFFHSPVRGRLGAIAGTTTLMELPHFRGHQYSLREGVHEGKDKSTVRAGVSPANGRVGPEELAKEFEPTAQSIRNWVEQMDLDEGCRQDGVTTDERQELARLRRENKQLRTEREILARAAAWFARETGSIPSGSSSS